MPRDAEAWLAQRGISREPLVVHPEPEGAAEPGPPPVTAEQAVRVAGQSQADAAIRTADAATTSAPAGPTLENDVAAAVAFVRRSTTATPQAEQRIRDKLAERGWSDAVIVRALERARTQRLVDDPSMASALVDERRAKGHAVSRIRQDLRARGFEDATITEALGDAEKQDPTAAAFAVARDRADRLTGVEPEAAFRRVVAYVARRGYPDALARKVAREAVFATRDAERNATR